MAERASQSGQEKPGTLARLLPILQWAPQYERGWLRPDLIAGLTVAALVVPKSLGYAGIAGVPIQHGLYAAAAGAILYAFFGTCKQIATGPSSALAALAANDQPRACRTPSTPRYAASASTARLRPGATGRVTSNRCRFSNWTASAEG